MSKERGQVLLLSLVIMIVLALMVIFIFDLQLAIRAKMKVETAEQAAALTAAEWQRNSLNLIGELNLVKASEVLLEDFVPGPGPDAQVLADTMRQVYYSCRALTEMQSRIAFIGPLIAFGAAQQAAKYNGISIYDYTKQESNSFFDEDESRYDSFGGSNSNMKYVYDDMRDYLHRLEFDPRYAGYEYCHYYAWRDPYINMLIDIRNRGLAVRGTGMAMMNSITPAWLGVEGIYEAILQIAEYGADNCRGIQLKSWGILSLPESYWEGDWWKVSYHLSSFPQQSEIYSLQVNFSSYSRYDYGTLEGIYSHLTNDEIPMLKSELLPVVTWCTYSGEWSHTTDPGNSGWYTGAYLRDVIKDSFLYNGPVAAAQTYERIKTISRYRADISTDTAENFAATERAALQAFKRTTEDGGIVRQTSQMNFRVGTDARLDSEGGVAAKVLGQLNQQTPPHESGVILPVFHGVSMIPSTMFSHAMFRARYTNLERFLLWLSSLHTLEPPTIKTVDDSGRENIVPTSPPSGTERYYQALLLLQDIRFRRSIWNPEYPAYSASFDDAFKDDYKYNPDFPSDGTSKGAGWLQEAYVGPRSGNDLREDNNYVKYYRDPDSPKTSEFLLFRQNHSNYVTNEEFCTWTYYGPGGSISHGQNIGPPRL